MGDCQRVIPVAANQSIGALFAMKSITSHFTSTDPFDALFIFEARLNMCKTYARRIV
jgi:hypothetical protein